MKILQTPVRFYPAVGGVEKYVLNLSSQLTQHNHAVTVICADEPKSTLEKYQRIVIKRLHYIFKVANTNITLSLFWEIMREEFDIVHTHFPTPWSAEISLLCALIKKRACIITYHNDVEKEGLLGLFTAIYNRTILQLTLAWMDKILVTQPKYANSSRYLSKFLDKIEVIPNGIASLPDIENIERYKRKILFVSVLDQYHRYKGLDFLIQTVVELARQWPEVTLEVVGRGDLVAEYKRLAVALGVEHQVNFLGYVNEETLAYLYTTCTVFVLPSIDFHEGFGIVLLEAMSYGMPVIASDIVGISDDIRKNNAGYVIPPQNRHAIAQAVNQVFRDPQEAARMGQNGRRLVKQQFLWGDITNRLETIYQELIN